MATGVSNFSISSSGNNINYTITWEGFGCSGSSQITIRLWDVNRNAVRTSAVFTSVGTTGTITGTFTSIYAGLFGANAIFMCDGNRVSAFQTLEIIHGSTIDPPPPATEPPPVSPPTPGVTPPSDPGFDYCIPTTGAVSMGDLNVVFGRNRNLANTLLSGTSNPSVAPSLFGVSFLPNNVVSPGKLTPNAISEFRGYCHVAPIVPATLNWAISHTVHAGITGIIDYFDINGNSQTIIVDLPNNSISGGGSSGLITNVKPGSAISCSVQNNSFNPTSTTIGITRNGNVVFFSPDTSQTIQSSGVVPNQGDNIGITLTAAGEDPFGGFGGL